MSLLSIEEIKAIIPHRYPFLLLDRVEELEAGKKIVAKKNVTVNEPFFQGHFPQEPVMPGVLIVEAMAQLSTILLRKKIGENHRDYHFLAYDVRSCQFYKPIFPRDRIDLRAEILAIYPIDEKTKINRLLERI